MWSARKQKWDFGEDFAQRVYFKQDTKRRTSDTVFSPKYHTRGFREFSFFSSLRDERGLLGLYDKYRVLLCLLGGWNFYTEATELLCTFVRGAGEDQKQSESERPVFVVIKQKTVGDAITGFGLRF